MDAPVPVTLVTDAAGRADSLSAQDYRDIYAELRTKCSLRQFIDLLQSTVSPSWWSQYEASTKHLDTVQRNELRRAVGLPELAPAAAAAVLAVTPEATVWRIGAGPANRVLLITPEAPQRLVLSVNGGVHIFSPEPPINVPTPAVTPVTRPLAARSPRVAIGGLRPATRAALDARRRAAGLTWDGYLARLSAEADVVE
jgi:hypothetical protein